MATGEEEQAKKADPADWPAGRPDLRGRIALSAIFVVLAKVVVLTLPLAYGRALDAMAGPIGPGRSSTVWLPMGLVLAYAAGRFATVLFDNVRNVIFERVGQEAVRKLTEDVFRRLHELSLRFHLSRRTGEVTKIVDRGSKNINTM